MKNEGAAEPAGEGGVESAGDAAHGQRSASCAVPGTQYSVPGTQYRGPGTSPGDTACPPNLKSQISNLKSSVEETALAVEALLAACPDAGNATEGVPYSAVARGLNWLLERVEQNQHRQPAPIGFYFAKLWYYERLYPLTFTVAALGRACRQFAPSVESDTTEQPHATRAT